MCALRVTLAVRKGLLRSLPLLHCYPVEAAAIANSMYIELAMEVDSVTSLTLWARTETH